MASVIRRLPQALANQIAAGEVVQRPASVLKELVENALDAGADRICVFIENAGKSLIQVTDNGIGMSEEDAQLCFERHATSKIYSAEELFAIRSMGFRGEALAAIAAVSQIELITRREEDELATQLNLEAGDILKKESAAASKGTSIAVRNVFFNVPARRNFLRSNPVETRHLISEFQRIALAYPQINFELQIDSTQIFHLKSSSQRKRIVALLGKSVDERLVPVEEETDLLRIHGFVGKPSKAKKTRGEQFFFVNGRFFRSSYLNHAIQGVYEGLIPEKHHPLYVLFIELDPGRVDVNVHPQKQEVKFEEEKIVYAYMQAAVRHALSKYSATPSLDFDTDAEFGHLDAFKRPVDRSQISISNPNRQDRMRQEGKSAQLPGSPGLLAEEAPWEALFKQAGNEVKEVPDSENLRLDEDWGDEPSTCVQLHQRYIFSPIKSGFMLIDQHAAHERILFERFLRQLRQQSARTQGQLFPQQIELAPADAILLAELKTELQNLGFDLADAGENRILVHGLPAELAKSGESFSLEQWLESYKQFDADHSLSKEERIAGSLAREHALAAGKTLDQDSMRELIDQLFACETPYAAPNGNLTFLTFTLEELAASFAKA